MTTDQTYKPSEGKREEFRKYLEKNGVLDALTKVLVNLYEEVDKPKDALEYIRDKLATQVGLETSKQMQTKIDELNARISSLEEELEKLKVAGTQAEASGETAAEEGETEPNADAPPEPSKEEEPALSPEQ